MKVRRSSTKQHIQSSGALKQSLNCSCPSSLDEAIKAGFIDYNFQPVEMELSFVHTAAFGKLEVRTTLDFYKDIYLGFIFNAGKCYKMNLFAEKLYKENGMFRLESISNESYGTSSEEKLNYIIFTFNYIVTSYFIQQYSDKRKLDLIVAKLINDMCKICINSTLEGGYKDEDYINSL